MATAVAWGWLGYLESPSIETSDRGTKVASYVVASAESQLSAVQNQAQKYAPDQLAAVQIQLRGAKENLAKGNYDAVVKAGPALAAAISSVNDATATRRAESEAALNKAKEDWGPLSADVPKSLAALQIRVDELATAQAHHRLPHGVTDADVASAKSELESLKSAWGEAKSTADNAANKADTVQNQAAEVMQSLSGEKPRG
jgi:chromosome segregation ATPase